MSSNPDWTCAVDPIHADTVDCQLADGSGLVAGGTAPPLTLTTRVAPDLSNVSLTNEASLSSATAQVGPEAVASSTVTVGAVDDLSITKTHTGTPHIGSALPFRIGVVNHGPSDAAGVAVEDVLPVGLDYVSVEEATARGPVPRRRRPRQARRSRATSPAPWAPMPPRRRSRSTRPSRRRPTPA
ncbi:hypothetical protein GCM10025867_15790 [Frondihabitans sucicola]|uniref:DUF11 domain-containing protein n=1 Tax=Frondihabitans sucicola TaxID=1268041 RepID=A0ABM8GLR1_9MICO|nr:hypothetical protein [Frondihabitans sucicola]BDZ49338.1 hypothetical protein GCM10025867_15790 [Frondihabitans sucicola]